MELITDRINDFMQLHKPSQDSVSEQKGTLEIRSSANPNNQGFLPDVVDISEEGKSRAASGNDEKSLWQGLHKLATNQQDEVQSSEDVAQKDPIDAAITKIQERISEIQERMERLKNNEDEASQDELEQLEAELMALNIQLMELNNKKLEQIKADKA